MNLPPRIISELLDSFTHTLINRFGSALVIRQTSRNTFRAISVQAGRCLLRGKLRIHRVNWRIQGWVTMSDVLCKMRASLFMHVTSTIWLVCSWISFCQAKSQLQCLKMHGACDDMALSAYHLKWM